jgi:hypothetical protein
MFYRSASLIVTGSVIGSLATAAVVLRLWAVGIRRSKIGADDVLIVIGLVRSSLSHPIDHQIFPNCHKVLALGLCVCNIIGAARFRFGNHEIYIESGELEDWPVAWLLLGYGKVSNYITETLNLDIVRK